MDSKIKLLIIAANYDESQIIFTSQELQCISDIQNSGRKRDNFEIIKIDHTKREDLSHYISQYSPNILHFSGHGTTDTGPLFAEDRNPPIPEYYNDFLALVDIYKNDIQAIILNVCQSANIGERLSKFIPIVIGTTRMIGDDSSILFSKVFYQNLFNGQNYHTAFQSALQEYSKNPLNNKTDYQIFSIDDNLSPFFIERKEINESDLYKENEKKYLTAISINQKDILALNSLSLLYIELKRIPEAEKWLNIALKHYPNNGEINHNLGLLLLSQKRYNEAEKFLKKSSEILPELKENWNSLGNLYLLFEKYNEAKLCFEKAIKQDENYIEPWHNLGKYYLIKKQYINAELSFKHALYLNPYYLKSLNGLGTVYLHQGNYTESEKIFMQILEEDPNQIETLNNLGILYRIQGKSSLAEKKYKEALSINPKDENTLNNLGEFYILQGKVKEAKEILNLLLEINPDHKFGRENFSRLESIN